MLTAATPSETVFHLISFCFENTLQPLAVRFTIIVIGQDMHMRRDDLNNLGVTTILLKPVSLEQFEMVISEYKIKELLQK